MFEYFFIAALIIIVPAVYLAQRHKRFSLDNREEAKALQRDEADMQRNTHKAYVITFLLSLPLLFLYKEAIDPTIEQLGSQLGTLVLAFGLLPLTVAILFIFAGVLSAVSARNKK